MSASGMTRRPLLSRVAHADWSKQLSKRWLARADQGVHGGWVLARPEPAGEPGTLFLSRLGVAPGEFLLRRCERPYGQRGAARSIEGWNFGQPVP
jgi:hypothetical protein